MDSDSSHWFLIAQAQKSGVLQVVVVSDKYAWNQNGKQSNSLSPISSTYSHYIHALLTPSKELLHSLINQLLNMIFILSLPFSCSIHIPLHQYLLKHSPSTINLESHQTRKYNTLLAFWNLGIATIQSQTHMNKIFGSCPSKLDDEMLPLHFGFQPK